MKVLAATLVAAGMVATTKAVYTEDGFVVTAEDIIEDEYIAMAHVEPTKCDELRKLVDKSKVETDGMERSMLEGPARQSKIGTACFITFRGTSQFKTLVENMEDIELVEPNAMVIPAAVESWGIDRIDQESLPLDDSFSSPYDGSGVNIYIVDTGINRDHVDFGGRGNYGADYINEGSQADRNGHGTHCAGTAAGGSYGIARGAQIYGVKVLSGSGSGSNSGVISGVEWAANHAKQAGKPAVISMSLGGSYSATTNNAVVAAHNNGAIVVVAAGNENQNACNVSPASAGGKGTVITVGSTTSSDSRSSFSNYGNCVDVFAPGSSITSAWIGSRTASNTISGTSMATPHVAGIAATFLQKYNGNRDQARSALMSAVASNKISGVNGSPNKLAQVAQSGSSPSPTPPTPTPPTPTPPTPPPSCWWCWWLDSAETGAQSPAPAPAPAPEVVAAPAVDNSGDALMAAVISGSTVAFVALAAGMVVYKRNKSRETVTTSATIEDQL